jgi:DNA mismatch repair protein MSH3
MALFRASSTIEALQSLNYTLLWSNGVMDTLLMYEHIPDLVRVIIWEGSWFEKCMWRTNETYLDSETDRAPGTWQMGEKACIKSERYPQGIPVWKSFAFHFWKSAVGPLGHTWTLAPEDFAGLNGGYGNQFLGEQDVLYAPKG